jgi:hypothetical protein
MNIQPRRPLKWACDFFLGIGAYDAFILLAVNGIINFSQAKPTSRHPI